MSKKGEQVLRQGLIKGLGDKSVRALLEGEIRTVDDVASSTPQVLEHTLKEHGVKNITAQRIEAEQWIEQAMEMQDEPEPESASKARAESVTSHGSRLRWRQYAGFQIYFANESGQPETVNGGDWRVRVKHIETGQSKDFSGSEKWRWLVWILERAHLPAADAMGMLTSSSPDSKAVPIRVNEGDDHMSEHKLKHGGVDITLKKVPDAFAIRLKEGRATSAETLEAAVGSSKTAVDHMDSTGPANNLEIFRVAEPDTLEAATDAMRESAAAEVVSHIYALGENPESVVVPQGTMTIQFAAQTSQSQREAILREFGLEVVREWPFMEHGYQVRLTRASPLNPLKTAERLQQRAEILVAEPNLLFKTEPTYEPPDPRYSSQWHLKNRGDQINLVAGADVGAEEAWDYETGKRNVVICIIDDGFELDHPDLAASGKIVAPIDFGQLDNDPRPVTNSDSHGTACAGVAVAEEGLGEVVGLAPGCALMPIRMSNWLGDDEVVAYFEHAVANNASVISCSWRAAPLHAPLSTAMYEIIRWAAASGRQGKGCVILFAAGNDYGVLKGTRPWDSQQMHLGFALHDDVMAIAASNSLDRHSEYSNSGQKVAVCAPSNGYPGRGIVTTDLLGIKGKALGDYRSDFGGTSSATPLVAGLAGLILSVNPDFTAAEVREIIQETADKIDPAGGQYINGHSAQYGYGRINAHKAVLRAIELRDSGIGEDSESSPDISLRIVSVTPSILAASAVVPTKRLQFDLSYELFGEDALTLTHERAKTVSRVMLSLVDQDNGNNSGIVTEKSGHLTPNRLRVTDKLTYPLSSNSNYAGRYELRAAVSVQTPAGPVRIEQAVLNLTL